MKVILLTGNTSILPQIIIFYAKLNDTIIVKLLNWPKKLSTFIQLLILEFLDSCTLLMITVHEQILNNSNINLLPMEKTEKKIPIRFKSDCKRFNRQYSLNMDKSKDNSKSHQHDQITQTYIKTPRRRSYIPTFDQSDFFKRLAHKISQNQKEQLQISQKIHISKQNYISKVNQLSAELQIKNHKIETYTKQIEKFRQIAQQCKQKRSYLQEQNKQLCKQLKQLQTSYKKLQIQTKRQSKQMQYMQKQIEFLQNINFDQKTKELQSFRERYLEEEIVKLREFIKKSKSEREKFLQQEITKLIGQKYILQTNLKSTQIANQCLLKQLNQTIQNQHQYIINSQQYIKLRQKYKQFLQEYNALRTEYSQLKNQDTNKKNQSSLISMSFSQAD